MSNQVYANLKSRRAYNINTQHIDTSEDGEQTAINNTLVLNNVQESLTDDDLLTIDNMGVVNKIPIDQLPATNPFDQDLNSFNIIQFNKIGVNMPYSDGVGSLPVLKLRNIDSPNPSSWGCRTEYYLTSSPNHPYMTINASRPSDQNITWGNYWNGINWVSSDNLDSFKFQRNFDRWNFHASFGDQFTGTPVIERIPMYIQANTDLGLYIDYTQDSSLYLVTPTTNTTTSNILTIENDKVVKSNATVDETGKIKANSADIGNTPTVSLTTDTSSQLKIIGPPGDLGPYPKTDLGGRLEIYNSDNIYPLLTFSSFQENDQALAFGTYGSTVDVWKKSDINYFKFQRISSKLNFVCNTSQLPAGSSATDKTFIIYDNTNNDPVFDIYSKIKWDIVDPTTISGNLIVRQNDKFVKLTGVIIDENDNIATNGTVTASTGNIPPEIATNKVIIKVSGSDELKQKNPEDLFLQDLSPSSAVEFSSVDTGQGANQLYAMDQDMLITSNVTHNNIFANLMQTDQILENTLNNGVDVTSWNIKTQSLTSDALVNITNPLRIDFKLFSDADAVSQIYMKEHDNHGIMFDCYKDPFISNDDSLKSSSVNGNIYINKDAGSLKFLITNAINKGVTFAKNTMVNVLELGKTYVNVNEPLTIEESVVMSGLPTSTNNTVLLTKFDGTNEIMQQAAPKYDYSFFENNIVETTINTINVYERIVYAAPTQTGDNLFTITNTGGLQYQYVGIPKNINISMNYNIHKSGGGSELYQFEMRLNGGKVGPSPKQKLEDNTKWQMLSVTGTIPMNTNDVLTFWVRSETATDNLTVAQFSFSAFQLI